jgi:hypothetical protein
MWGILKNTFSLNCVKVWVMDSAHNYDNYINIPSTQTYTFFYIIYFEKKIVYAISMPSVYTCIPLKYF